MENPERSLYSFGVAPKTLTSINNSANSKINAVINQVSDVLEDVSQIYDDIDGITAITDTVEAGAQVNKIETIMVKNYW